MSHKPAVVAAQGPGATVHYLLPSSCCQQKGHLHWTSPTAQEGGKPEPQPSRKAVPVHGPALTSVFPRETPASLGRNAGVRGILSAPGRRALSGGNCPDPQGRETLVQIQNTLRVPALRTLAPRTHTTPCQPPCRQDWFPVTDRRNS